MRLRRIRSSMIFIDSNIPMYLVGASHPHKVDAQRLLEDLLSERVRPVAGCRTRKVDRPRIDSAFGSRRIASRGYGAAFDWSNPEFRRRLRRTRRNRSAVLIAAASRLAPIGPAAVNRCIEVPTRERSSMAPGYRRVRAVRTAVTSCPPFPMCLSEAELGLKADPTGGSK